MKRSSRAGRLTQLERNQRTTGIFFILPSLVLCAIFMVVPLINVIRYSLTDWDGLSKTYNFVGLYNYMHLHEIEGFGEMMLRDLRHRRDRDHHHRLVPGSARAR